MNRDKLQSDISNLENRFSELTEDLRNAILDSNIEKSCNLLSERDRIARLISRKQAKLSESAEES